MILCTRELADMFERSQFIIITGGKKMLKKVLNKLVKEMQERNSVDKILQAKDLREVYNEEKAAMKKQLKDFKELVQSQVNLGEIPIYDPENIINSDVAVEVMFILLMCKLDEYRIFSDYGKTLNIALKNVKDHKSVLAYNFYMLIRKENLSRLDEYLVLKRVLFK